MTNIIPIRWPPPVFPVEHPTLVIRHATLFEIRNPFGVVLLPFSLASALRVTLRMIDAERVWPPEAEEKPIPVAPGLDLFLCGDSVIVRLGSFPAQTAEIEAGDIGRVVEGLGG
jgi:hypothetical protein